VTIRHLNSIPGASTYRNNNPTPLRMHIAYPRSPMFSRRMPMRRQDDRRLLFKQRSQTTRVPGYAPHDSPLGPNDFFLPLIALFDERNDLVGGPLYPRVELGHLALRCIRALCFAFLFTPSIPTVKHVGYVACRHGNTVGNRDLLQVDQVILNEDCKGRVNSNRCREKLYFAERLFHALIPQVN